MTGHAAGLARHWNRPMGRSWRNDFLSQSAFLIGLCILGPPWCYIGAFTFTLTVAAWTTVTVTEYRKCRRRMGRDDHESLKGGPHA